MKAVLQSAGLSGREMAVLQEHGWDAWRAAQSKQRSRRGRGGAPPEAAAAAAVEAGRTMAAESSFLRWACCGGLAALAERQGRPVEAAAAAQAAAAAEGEQLEAVVVEPGGLPPAEVASGRVQVPPSAGVAAKPAEQAAAAAAAPAAPPAAEPAGEGDLEAGGTPVWTAEEQGGVLHATHMRCRTRCGRRCQTICSLVGKRGAAGGPASEPPAPMCDPSPRAAQQQAPTPQQLGAIAEEEGRSSPPPSPPASPTPRPEEGPRGSSWWSYAAALVGWQTAPRRVPSLARTLSSASSLGSSASSPLSDGAGTRGPARAGDAFPLVLDWSAGGGERRRAPEELT